MHSAVVNDVEQVKASPVSLNPLVMIFCGSWDMDSVSKNSLPNLEFPGWSCYSAVIKPPLPRNTGKRYRSFMIDDILNDKQETTNQDNCAQLFSMEKAFQQRRELVVLPPPAVPVFSPINFLYNMPQRPAAPTCSPTHREDTDNTPKYFRTILKESRKHRRNRTVFSHLQMQKMEDLFQRKKYLSTQDRNDFAKSLCLTSLQVKTWYQNRRMKWKKEMLSIDPTAVTTRAKGRPRKGEF